MQTHSLPDAGDEIVLGPLIRPLTASEQYELRQFLSLARIAERVVVIHWDRDIDCLTAVARPPRPFSARRTP